MIAFLIFYWIFSFIVVLTYGYDNFTIEDTSEHIKLILVCLFACGILFPALISHKL